MMMMMMKLFNIGFHPRIIRIIDIRANLFEDTREIMDENNRRLISRILSEPDHPFTRKLQIIAQISLEIKVTKKTKNIKLIAKSKAYSNSFVRKYLNAFNRVR